MNNVNHNDLSKIKIRTQILTVADLLHEVSIGTMSLFDAKSDNKSEKFSVDAIEGSQYIESMLLGIVPQPCMLIDETLLRRDDKLTLIDGVGRLFILHTFTENNWELSGLELLPNENGKRYNDLTIVYRNIIMYTKITCHIIEKGTSDIAKEVITQRWLKSLKI